MQLVERIKALCQARGITLNQLEKAIGLKSTISRWEDHDPSIGKVRLVAQYFGVTVSDLIDDWGGIDMSDAWTEAQKETPATIDGDGWKDTVRALPPDLLALLGDFVTLAKEDPETAARHLSFAVQELQSRQ